MKTILSFIVALILFGAAFLALDYLALGMQGLPLVYRAG